MDKHMVGAKCFINTISSYLLLLNAKLSQYIDLSIYHYATYHAAPLPQNEWVPLSLVLHTLT